jgi:hypothetical protein
VERTMSRTTGGTLGPLTGVNDTAWIAKLMGDPKGLPEQRVPVCRHRQRNSCARNRMGEICASGSVGGEGGNILAYLPGPASLSITKRLNRPISLSGGRQTPFRSRGGTMMSIASSFFVGGAPRG